MVIPAQFDKALGFHGGLAPVRILEKWGYIDSSGKVVIPPSFSKTIGFSEVSP
jgi:hypothetical protein